MKVNLQKQVFALLLLLAYLGPLFFLGRTAYFSIEPPFQAPLLWSSLLLTLISFSIILILLKNLFVVTQFKASSSFFDAIAQKSFNSLTAEDDADKDAKTSYQKQINASILALKEREQALQNQAKELFQEWEACQKIKSENDYLNKQLEAVYDELRETKSKSEQNLEQKERQIEKYVKVIKNQHTLIEKYQDKIVALDDKNKGLISELHVLLDLESSTAENKPNPHLNDIKHPVIDFSHNSSEEEDAKLLSRLPSSTSEQAFSNYDALNQLNKHLETIQSLSGKLGQKALDGTPFSNYVKDLRPLFKVLGDETSLCLFAYSQTQKEVIFVNEIVKSLLGWQPEQFVKNFPFLISQGRTAWQQAVERLGPSSRPEFVVTLRTSSGEEKCLHCILALASQGIFKDLVIGTFYTDF